jgi:hypothetical protein
MTGYFFVFNFIGRWLVARRLPNTITKNRKIEYYDRRISHSSKE